MRPIPPSSRDIGSFRLCVRGVSVMSFRKEKCAVGIVSFIHTTRKFHLWDSCCVPRDLPRYLSKRDFQDSFPRELPKMVFTIFFQIISKILRCISKRDFQERFPRQFPDNVVLERLSREMPERLFQERYPRETPKRVFSKIIFEETLSLEFRQ